jgi:L-serine dehydratase
MEQRHGVSVFDLFKIGIGPSSSHTVGPMRAAARFVERWLVESGQIALHARARRVFGSLALTGRGHGTDKAVLMGLEGHLPNRIDPDLIPAALDRIRGDKRIRLHGTHEIAFDEKRDLIMNKRQKLPFHTNGMRFAAYDARRRELATRDYYSVGGGFVVNQDEAAEDRIVADTTTELPYPFIPATNCWRSARHGLEHRATDVCANERPGAATSDIAPAREIWAAMQACVRAASARPARCRADCT